MIEEYFYFTVLLLHSEKETSLSWAGTNRSGNTLTYDTIGRTDHFHHIGELLQCFGWQVLFFFFSDGFQKMKHFHLYCKLLYNLCNEVKVLYSISNRTLIKQIFCCKLAIDQAHKTFETRPPFGSFGAWACQLEFDENTVSRDLFNVLLCYPTPHPEPDSANLR